MSGGLCACQKLVLVQASSLLVELHIQGHTQVSRPAAFQLPHCAEGAKGQGGRNLKLASAQREQGLCAASAWA